MRRSLRRCCARAAPSSRCDSVMPSPCLLSSNIAPSRSPNGARPALACKVMSPWECGSCRVPANDDLLQNHSWQADQKDIEDWEQRLAVSRSAGHFFQSLYQTDKKKPVGGGIGRSAVRKRFRCML